MSSEVGLRWASDIVDLCRLPVAPHERLGLTLTRPQALLFDLSFVRAAARVREYDAGRDMQSIGKNDATGALSVAVMQAHQLRRS